MDFSSGVEIVLMVEGFRGQVSTRTVDWVRTVVKGVRSGRVDSSGRPFLSAMRTFMPKAFASPARRFPEISN